MLKADCWLVSYYNTIMTSSAVSVSLNSAALITENVLHINLSERKQKIRKMDCCCWLVGRWNAHYDIISCQLFQCFTHFYVFLENFKNQH